MVMVVIITITAMAETMLRGATIILTRGVTGVKRMLLTMEEQTRPALKVGCRRCFFAVVYSGDCIVSLARLGPALFFVYFFAALLVSVLLGGF